MLRALIESQAWTDAERRLGAKFRLELLPIHERVVEIKEAHIFRSAFELPDIEAAFRDDVERFLRFAEAWYFDAMKREYGEEWDPEEGDQQAGTDKQEKVLGMSRGFLVGYALFFLYAKHKPKELTTYLKEIRMPHAAKVSRDVRRIYAATASPSA